MRTCCRYHVQPDFRAFLRKNLGAILMASLVACSPSLNWREVRPLDAQAVALFPCKPDDLLRQVDLAGLSLSLHLVSCEAQGRVFALAHAALPSGAQASEVLDALRRATESNVGSKGVVLPAWSVRGMGPDPAAQHLRWRGVRPDGSSLEVEAVYFSGGDRVYQASIVGSSSEVEAAEMFFSSFRLTP